MFFYQRLKLKTLVPFFIILFVLISLIDCKRTNPKDEPFEVYLKRSTKELCQKMVSCNYNIVRTFPKELQKEVTVEICEETLLTDFEEKLNLHTDSMKQLAKSCYDKILEANCTQYLAFAYGDLSCYSLKKESDKVFAKAKELKKNPSNLK